MIVFFLCMFQMIAREITMYMLFLFVSLLAKTLSSSNIEEIFQKLTTHKGLILNEKMRLHHSSEYHRIRLDIPLKQWMKIRTDLEAVKKIISAPDEQGLLQLRIINLEVQRTIEGLDFLPAIQRLKGQIQPTLTFFPEEGIEDPTGTTSKYETKTKTYYLEQTCNNAMSILAETELEDILTTLGESLSRRKRENDPEMGNSTAQDDSHTPKPITHAPVIPSPSPAAPAGNKSATSEISRPPKSNRQMDPTSTFAHLLQHVQIAIDNIGEIVSHLIQGSYPEGCITMEQWNTIIQTVFPQLDPKQLGIVRETFLMMLSNYPLTVYKVVPDPEDPIIRVLFLLPNPKAIQRLRLYHAQYINIKIDEEQRQLSFQPSEIMIDDSLGWFSTENPQANIRTACLPSWKSVIQQWCFGELMLLPLTTKPCLERAISRALPPPGKECYSRTKVHQSQIIPYYDGRFLISPTNMEEIELQCPTGKFIQTIEEVTMVTVPKDCTAVTATHVIPASLKSKIVDLPEDWKPYNPKVEIEDDVTIKELTPLHDEEDQTIELFQKPRVIHHYNVEKPTPTDEGLLEEITAWLENFSGMEIQILCGVISSIVVLYCCCAPVSWPRCNCCIWCCQFSWEGIQAIIINFGQCIRSIRNLRARRRRTTVIRSGETELRPIEREMQMQLVSRH